MTWQITIHYPDDLPDATRDALASALMTEAHTLRTVSYAVLSGRADFRFDGWDTTTSFYQAIVPALPPGATVHTARAGLPSWAVAAGISAR